MHRPLVLEAIEALWGKTSSTAFLAIVVNSLSYSNSTVAFFPMPVLLQKIWIVFMLPYVKKIRHN